MANNERFPSPHVFSGLEPGTKYKFTSVYPAEGNKLESPESPVLEASTRFLVDNDGWTVGQGPVDGFEIESGEGTHYKVTIEDARVDHNVRTVETGPFGLSEVVWKNAKTSVTIGGHYERRYIVDTTKTYIILSYFKIVKRAIPTDPGGHRIYLGSMGRTVGLEAVNREVPFADHTNPYLNSVKCNLLNLNEWYVSVGIIYGEDANTNINQINGVYSLTDKSEVPLSKYFCKQSYKYTSAISNVDECTRVFTAHASPAEPGEIWFASPLVRELGDLTLEDILSGDRERVFYKKEKE